MLPERFIKKKIGKILEIERPGLPSKDNKEAEGSIDCMYIYKEGGV